MECLETAWFETVGQAFGDLGSLLFPAGCRGCEAVADEGGWYPDLCRRCAGVLQELSSRESAIVAPRGLDGIHAWLRFEGPVRRLLHDVKYGGAVRTGVRTGRRMAAAPGIVELIEQSDLVVPVPLHWRRRWRRGHNQAETLARGLVGRRLGGGGAGGPPIVRGLSRRRPTRPQVGLSRAARGHNVAGAFRVRRRARHRVRERRILLVDDVVTTGATAVAAATALREAGATRVVLLAAAWAPDDR